jgi:hypothetical protein
MEPESAGAAPVSSRAIQRRRANLLLGGSIGVSALLILWLAAGARPETISMWILPMALVVVGIGYYAGMYYYVRQRGYHGAWTLLVLVGPLLQGATSALGWHPGAELAPSAQHGFEALMNLSGMIALAMLPRRR